MHWHTAEVLTLNPLTHTHTHPTSSSAWPRGVDSGWGTTSLTLSTDKPREHDTDRRQPHSVSAHRNTTFSTTWFIRMSHWHSFRKCYQMTFRSCYHVIISVCGALDSHRQSSLMCSFSTTPALYLHNFSTLIKAVLHMKISLFIMVSATQPIKTSCIMSSVATEGVFLSLIK